jgi:hypothetical protein
MRAARAATLGLTLILAVLAGIGILYLLRQGRAVTAGPRVFGALPLQQLAGGESQPLGRMIVAWLPSGLVVGLIFSQLTQAGRVWRALVVAVGGAALLLAAGAVSDAVAVSDPVAPHVWPQFGHAAVWVAMALLVIGALAVTRGWRMHRVAAAAAPSAR